MDATLEDLEKNRIHCTLLNDYAVKMQHFLDNHDSSLPVIVLLRLCKHKKYFGNAGLKIDRAVRRDLVNLRTFHMEYDICSGRLSACFVKGFGLEVAPFVMLRDPNENEIEVAVEKKNGKVYFADGWPFLKKFYGILAGTWITVIFANRHLFLFEVRNMHGKEFVYPQFTPPQRMLLWNLSAHDYRNSFIRYGSNALFLPTNFFDTIVKELTDYDVTSGMLKMNWLGFCQSAFPAEKSELTLDILGNCLWIFVKMKICHAFFPMSGKHCVTPVC